MYIQVCSLARRRVALYVQAQHAAMSDSPEEEDMEQVTSAAVLAEEVTSAGERQSWPPPGSLHAAQPNSQDSPNVSPNSKGGPM